MIARGPVGLSMAILLVVASAALGQQQGQGRLEGRVVRDDGSGVRGVTALLDESAATAVTDQNGNFSFGSLAVGTYALTLILGANSMVVEVHVEAGSTSRVERTVDWTAGYGETVTVVSASRHREKIVDAPAAVSVVTEEEIERQAGHGQLPKLVEFVPGAELTQSGVYDFNFNTRGFNSSLNRRVATLIDGRDPSVPFLGSQEWAAISFPLDDISNVEFVRGPSSALYGANASSGVLNVVTKAPRFSQGGKARATFGELGTASGDFRWAGRLGEGWFAKFVGGARSSGDFAVSRNGAAEYSRPCPPGVTGDCLPQEAVPLPRQDDVKVYFGSARVDRYLDGGVIVTLEGGTSDVAGPIFQTGIGRIQTLEVERPWARFNLSTDDWNVLASWTHRDAPRQMSLSAGTNVALRSHSVQAEAQRRWSFPERGVRLVTGGSWSWDRIDSFDPDRGLQTLVAEPVTAHHGAGYSQVDWNVTDRLKLVLAGRFDDSELHDTRVSPKGSVVFAVRPTHTLRLTYNEAFQVPNYSEFFLQVDAARPADLSGLNAFCTPFGVDCGFGVTRVLGVGNEDLGVEEIRTWEVGYNGILADSARLSVDYYRSAADNFITDLLPQLGTPIGRVNPAFGPWQGPAGLPAAVVEQIRAAAPLLSNDADGSNVLVAASYTNFGAVDTQGLDVGLEFFRGPWSGSASYSWFDFEIQTPGLDTLLLPNSPEHKVHAGGTYVADRWDLGLAVRWSDEFRWSVGPFLGDVEAYTVVDLTANVDPWDRWTVGLDVSNLLDNEHYESFGGDLLGRRALVNVGYAW